MFEYNLSDNEWELHREIKQKRAQSIYLHNHTVWPCTREFQFKYWLQIEFFDFSYQRLIEKHRKFCYVLILEIRVYVCEHTSDSWCRTISSSTFLPIIISSSALINRKIEYRMRRCVCCKVEWLIKILQEGENTKTACLIETTAIYLVFVNYKYIK